MALPWTKFQDFYLRLGLLKALVAVLSPQRRSTANDAIYRRLQTPLADPAAKYPALWQQVADHFPWYREQHARGAFDKPSVTEALLVLNDCPSWLFAFTKPTVYKTLDWGHDLQLVGRGNQISERGLMLRLLLPAEAADRFFEGDPLAWNPFQLTDVERLFFLYHLTEIDQVTEELIGDLAEHHPDTILESADAAKLTCRALFRVLDRAQPNLIPHDLPAFRIARELACVIAKELEMDDLLAECGAAGTRRLPKPVKIRARGGIGGGSPSRTRRTTKNADHQTIPRFEQLVDLGVLVKPSPASMTGREKTGAVESPKRRWRYQPTEFCRRWHEAKAAYPTSGQRWEWDGFAHTAVRALLGDSPAARKPPLTYATIVRYFWSAYEATRRPAGHTPADSVMLLAMLRAATDGYAIEMSQFHEMLLAVKQQSLLPEHAFFASGNDLDKMFVLLRPDFPEKVSEVADRLPPLLERV